MCCVLPSEELAGQAHQSRCTAAALGLHVHLQSHFPSRVDRALLVRAACHIAHAALLVKQARGFLHGHPDHLRL